MRLSIIATISDEPDFLEEFYTRISTAAWILVGEDYELVLVTGKEPLALKNTNVLAASEDSHLRMLAAHGSREDGIMAAMRMVNGERVFLIDVSAGEDPEWLLAFSAALEESDADLIYAVEEKRPSGWLKAILSFFPFLFGRWLNTETGLSAAFMTRRVIEAILAKNDPALISRLPVPFEEFRQLPFTVISSQSANSAA